VSTDLAPPRFSFLVTAFGTERVLGETIESVLQQERPDWELVVVDNGRSDAVSAVVEAYLHDPRIRLIRQPNRGYAGGVMAAAAVARGEFLCVLDSDDLLRPTFTTVIGEFLHRHPEADAVGCDAERFADGDDALLRRAYFQTIGMPRPPRGGTRLSKEDVLRGMVPYYTGAIRREAWVAIGGYRTDAPEVEPDVVAWIELAGHHEVYVLRDRLARNRVRADSLSRSTESIDRFEDRLISSFGRAGEEAGTGIGLTAGHAVRRLRYHQALRRARLALVAGEVDSARHWAGEALSQKRTARAVAVVLLLRVAPRLLVRIHPVKRRAAFVVDRLRERVGV
jgi:glycosyltransferase involved in cell wall biosynthesis